MATRIGAPIVCGLLCSNCLTMEVLKLPLKLCYIYIVIPSAGHTRFSPAAMNRNRSPNNSIICFIYQTLDTRTTSHFTEPKPLIFFEMLFSIKQWFALALQITMWVRPCVQARVHPIHHIKAHITSYLSDTGFAYCMSLK